MKLLLFDQNISPRLVEHLSDLYPNSVHVSMVDMGNALDIEVWQYAYDNDYIIVTKDADFRIGALSEDSEIGILTLF